MFSRAWLRFGKLGLILLLIYLMCGYITLLTIIIHRELAVLDVTEAISVINFVEAPSTLQGQVRNIFGDPVPHAVVIVGRRLIQADNNGFFFMNNLRTGRQTLEILAGTYEKYSREIQLEAGDNDFPIKYETGLWPEVFLADFHIFYKNFNEVFGILGFANGTDEPLFIHKAILLNPQGTVIIDLLQDHHGLTYFSELSTKIEIVEQPQRALKWAGRVVQSGEFLPLAGSFRPGPYSLEIHYAFSQGHQSSDYLVLVITDHLDLDNDWNPHLP